MNQNAWLKPYIDLNIEQRMTLKKIFCKLMNNVVFKKFMDNTKNQKDIKPIRREVRRNYLVSEPSYHTTIFFSDNLLAKEMDRT